MGLLRERVGVAEAGVKERERVVEGLKAEVARLMGEVVVVGGEMRGVQGVVGELRARNKVLEVKVGKD